MSKKKQTKILVVDDDPTILCFIEGLLSTNEYQSILASSGEEALDIISKQNSIDLLLTDIDMPGINGIVFAKYISDLYPKMKILFMSGYILPSTLFSILGKKVAFLQKPFQKTNLIAQIKFVLGY